MLTLGAITTGTSRFGLTARPTPLARPAPGGPRRARAGGAGLGGFFTPVGAGTLLAEGKEQREIDGVLHVLEAPVRASAALSMERRTGTRLVSRSGRSMSAISPTCTPPISTGVNSFAVMAVYPLMEAPAS